MPKNSCAARTFSSHVRHPVLPKVTCLMLSHSRRCASLTGLVLQRGNTGHAFDHRETSMGDTADQTYRHKHMLQDFYRKRPVMRLGECVRMACAHVSSRSEAGELCMPSQWRMLSDVSFPLHKSNRRGKPEIVQLPR